MIDICKSSSSGSDKRMMKQSKFTHQEIDAINTLLIMSRTETRSPDSTMGAGSRPRHTPYTQTKSSPFNHSKSSPFSLCTPASSSQSKGTVQGFYTPVAVTGAPMSLGSLCISSKQKGKPVQEDKNIEKLRSLGFPLIPIKDMINSLPKNNCSKCSSKSYNSTKKDEVCSQCKRGEKRRMPYNQWWELTETWW